MKKLRTLFARLKSMPKRTSAIAILAAAVIVPAVTLAWGPSRDTYTTAHPADHVTFNSITDNPVQGDERNFVQIKDASASNSTYADSIKIQPGHTYTMFIYYHNDASSSLNASKVGIATGAYVKTAIPATVNGSTKSVSYIGATNATPTEVWDDVTLTSDSSIALSMVSGSAHIYNKGTTNGAALSDNIATTGTAIGYDALDGTVPGCNDYAGYVTYNVTAASTPTPTTSSFTVSKEVSKHSANNWVESYKAQPGETVDYLIEYKNTGTALQNNVVLKDQLPAGETYVAGSTIYGNALHPAGIKASDTITGNGINVGSYNGGGNAWAIFSATIPANDNLTVCGTNTLTNTGSASVGSDSKSDTAVVSVDKTCLTPVYTCNALTSSLVKDTQYSFKPSATASNGATITSYSYDFGDGTKVTQTSADAVTHTYAAKTANYTATLTVNFSVNGVAKSVTSTKCATKICITVTPATPVYTCNALTATLVKDNTYSFTPKATASNGATIVNYMYDFGDGTKSTSTNANSVNHTYAPTKTTTYNATLTVTFDVNGVQKTVTNQYCATPVNIVVLPPAVYTCNALTATLVKDNTYSYKTSATATNGATIVNFMYDFGDGTKVTSTTLDAVTHTYTPTKTTTYTATVSVTFLVNGQKEVVTSSNCAAKVTVIVTPPAAVYTCDLLTASLVKDTTSEYTFNGKATAYNGASITGYVFNFGDGNSQTVTNPTNVLHTYVANGKTYTATLSVNISVNGQTKTVTSDACNVTITVGQTPECKPGIPVGDSRCTTVVTPTELPHTGEGVNIGAFIGLGALIASIGYYVTSRRALLGR